LINYETANWNERKEFFLKLTAREINEMMLLAFN